MDVREKQLLINQYVYSYYIVYIYNTLMYVKLEIKIEQTDDGDRWEAYN